MNEGKSLTSKPLKKRAGFRAERSWKKKTKRTLLYTMSLSHRGRDDDLLALGTSQPVLQGLQGAGHCTDLCFLQSSLGCVPRSLNMKHQFLHYVLSKASDLSGKIAKPHCIHAEVNARKDWEGWIQMSKHFLFESVAFLLLRLFIKSKLPEP